MQANTVARVISGQTATYDALPWFWSEQYDIELQTIGLNVGYNGLVVRDDPECMSFSIVYLRNGTVIALDCVNAPRDFAQGRTLITRKYAPDLRALEDASVSLKSLEAGASG